MSKFNGFLIKVLESQKAQLNKQINRSIKGRLTENKIKESVDNLKEAVELVKIGLSMDDIDSDCLKFLEMLSASLEPINNDIKILSRDSHTPIREPIRWSKEGDIARMVIQYNPLTQPSGAKVFHINDGNLNGRGFHVGRIIETLSSMYNNSEVRVHGINNGSLTTQPLINVLDKTGELHVWLIDSTTEVIGFKFIDELGNPSMRLLYFTITTDELTLSGVLLPIGENVKLIKTFYL